MATYFARIMDAQTGGEGAYEFEAADDLMGRTGDEIVNTFFDAVDHDVLHDHADWELNGVVNSRERHIVTAIGALIPKKDGPPIPFMLMISDRNLPQLWTAEVTDNV